MYSEKLKMMIKHYKEFINAKKSTVGSVLKHHREDKKLTLDEVSYGICSTSYLCKIEKNQIIPNETILKELAEKLEVKEVTFVSSKESIADIMNIVRSKKVDKELIEKAKDKNDYQAKLIIYAYYIFEEKDLKKAYASYLDLLKYYMYFEKTELLLYLYISYHHLYMEKRYKEVVELYIQFEYFEDKNEIRIDLQRTLIKSLFKLGRYIDAHNQIEYLFKKDSLRLTQEDIKIYKEYDLIFKSRVLDKNELLMELEDITNGSSFNKDLILFNYYYFNKQYTKSLTYSSKIKNLNSYYFIINLFNLSKLNNTELIEKEINELKDHDNFIYIEILDYFKYIKVDNNILINKMEQLLSYTKSINNFQLKELLYDELATRAAKNGMYKFSYNVLKHENEELKEKALVIYKND